MNKRRRSVSRGAKPGTIENPLSASLYNDLGLQGNGAFFWDSVFGVGMRDRTYAFRVG